MAKGYHGDTTNKETECQECSSSLPPTRQAQPPIPKPRAAHRSVSAPSDFRHHFSHTSPLYLPVCGGECVHLSMTAILKAITFRPSVFQAGGSSDLSTGSRIINNLNRAATITQLID